MAIMAACLASFQPASAHGSLDELIWMASAKLEKNPANHAVLLKRAKLHLKHGDMEPAMTDIKAAELLTVRAEAAYVTGLYHLANNDYPAAITAFSDYRHLYPSHVPSIYNRAIAHKKLGLISEAIADYQILLDVSQVPSPDYYLELAALEATVEPQGLELALQSLDRGITRLGPLVSLQQAAIAYEMARKDYRGALLRHETLKPWLGKTKHWRMLKEQLSAYVDAPTQVQFSSVDRGLPAEMD
jgi:tetratricopeptide (TPR) repeat protein